MLQLNANINLLGRFLGVRQQRLQVQNNNFSLSTEFNRRISFIPRPTGQFMFELNPQADCRRLSENATRQSTDLVTPQVAFPSRTASLQLQHPACCRENSTMNEIEH